MIPYGIKKKDDYFEDKELLGVMKPTTYEMLCRPSIGMSEFGESVEHSPPIIRSLYRQIDLDEVIDHLEEVKQLSEMFNTRGNCPQAPNQSDLKRLIRFMIQPNDRMEDMLTRTEEMAMYLYSSINNIRQMQLLMMNPKEFASMSQHEQGKDGEFKRNPTLEGMLGYLKQEIFGSHVRRGDVRYRERLLRELDQPSRKRRSGEHSEEQPRSKSRRTSRRRSPSASHSSEEEQRQSVPKSRRKSAAATSGRSYGGHRRSDTTKRAELLRTSSSESEHAVTTKRSSRPTRTTEKHSRPKRTAKTDVSYSEDESAEVARQERSRDAKRTSRSNVSAH